MLELDRIYQADAFDMLPHIDDGSIDLVICDGPYGITTNKWDRIDNIQEYTDCCINRRIRYHPDQTRSGLRENPSFPRKRESRDLRD